MRNRILKIFFTTILVLGIFSTSIIAENSNLNDEEKIYEIVGGKIQSRPEEENLIQEDLTGEYQLGMGGVDLNRQSFKFGEYSGIEGDKIFAI
jgi:hypothetical protein